MCTFLQLILPDFNLKICFEFAEMRRRIDFVHGQVRNRRFLDLLTVFSPEYLVQYLSHLLH